MALQMVDRGDSYHVIYLGSCMLSHMSTGLGVLQKPLRELYFRYRQSGGGPAAQERYLRMSSRGMTMTYKESATSQPTEVFYAMPSILFWDAVQFCTVRNSQDKRLRGAFEPVDNDHSRNKDNLFSVLEKKYHFLQQMTHPPLFTCVLRRTQGVKALDVHAFVCSSDTEALGLVRSLHTVHAHYKSDENVETGVFGYRPFTTTPSGPTLGGGANSTATGGGPGDQTAGAPPPDGHSPSSTGGRRQTGSGSAGSGSLPGSLYHPHHQEAADTPPPRPAPRPLSLGRHSGGVRVIPTGGAASADHQPAVPQHQLPVRPQSFSRLSAHGLSSSLSSLSSNHSTSGGGAVPSSSNTRQGKVYQLTQQDFQRHNAALYLHDNAEDDAFTSPARRPGTEEPRSPPEPDDHHVYQYIQHIDDSPERENPTSTKSASSSTSSPHQAALRNNRNRNPPTTKTPTHNNNGSIERDTVSRSRAQIQETLANQHNSISRNLNQLFSQTPPPPSQQQQQGRQAERKQPSSSSSSSSTRATIFGAPFDPPPAATQQQYSQLSRPAPAADHHRASSGGAGAKLGQAYGHNAGNGGGSFPGADSFYDDRRPPSRLYGGEGRKGSNGSVDSESLRSHVPAPPRPTSSRSGREDVRQHGVTSGSSGGSGSQHGSPFAARDSTADAPARPVAKVPPHKVTGVKVFPGSSMPSAGSLKATKSPEQRKSAFIDDRKPPRRPTSKYFDEPQYMDESSSSGSSPTKSPPQSPASNWAFGGRGSGDDSGTGTMSGDRNNTEDSTMNEKLLLNKKKDAEIASVLQHMRFDYDEHTMSPGLPAGNNFERSLGYFP